MDELTVEQLSELLKDAEIAHADYRRANPGDEPGWARWYAEYIMSRLPEARWE